MAYSIYDKFLTISDCKYYCNQIANRLGLSTFDYFYDKYTELQFPGDSNLRTFKVFNDYEDWKIKFNLCKPATISKMGIDAYVLKHKELTFHLTLKGFSFIYVCKFSAKNHNETDNVIYGVLEPKTNIVYEEESNGQLAMIL